MKSNLLADSIVSISISDAPDMEKLGYPGREVDRAFLTLCGTLIRAGARIAYGGNLDPQGYTMKVFRYLARNYAVRKNVPAFIHYIPEPELFTADYHNVYHLLQENKGIVESVVIYGGEVAGTLVPLNEKIGIRWATDFSKLPLNTKKLDVINKHDLEIWSLFSSFGSTPPAIAFTQMREIVSNISSARIVMGGKMGLLDLPTDHYQGKMPGIVEEAILSFKAQKPVIVLGAFGGAARDIAIALGLMEEDDKVVRGPQMDSYQESIDLIASFQSQISKTEWEDLKEIAKLDRIETISYKIVDFLSKHQGVRDQSKGLP